VASRCAAIETLNGATENTELHGVFLLNDGTAVL